MSPKPFSAAEKEQLFQAKTYLLNSLHKELTIKKLAREAGLGEQRFIDGFQLLFGYTPGNYLHEARMLTALVLLLHSEKTPKEIAILCGYQHYQNFLSAFKRFFGRTPGSVV